MSQGSLTVLFIPHQRLQSTLLHAVPEGPATPVLRLQHTAHIPVFPALEKASPIQGSYLTANQKATDQDVLPEPNYRTAAESKPPTLFFFF